MKGDRICELHPVERPRERLLSRGAQALSDEELLAVVLRTGYVGMSVLELSRDILKRHPGGSLARLPVRELSAIKGVGPSRACGLAASLELSRRWQAQDDADAVLDTPSNVWRELKAYRGRRKEHFLALYLDACNRLLHLETVSVGTLTASLVHPREVFAPALERGAAGLIVAHNHPSGSPQPSPDDRETTRRLAEAGRILGVPLLDHVVVAERRFFSFREHGLLPL